MLYCMVSPIEWPGHSGRIPPGDTECHQSSLKEFVIPFLKVLSDIFIPAVRCYLTACTGKLEVFSTRDEKLSQDTSHHTGISSYSRHTKPDT